MRVGILTYHNAINYGAVLQAYALQQVLKDMGVNCDIIDYSCPAVEKQYRRKTLSDHAHWKIYVMDFLGGHRLDRKKAEFKKFGQNYLTLSEKVHNIKNETFDQYDVIIAGSDQVFNPKNTEGDSAYLLDFDCRAKKIAYAASIGDNSFLSLWKEKYHVDYQSLLRKFNHLSFREDDAAAFVSQLLGGSYASVVDPVLLAGNGLWQMFQEEPSEDYIFVYNLGNLPALAQCTKKMSKETGLKVYVVSKDIKGDYMFRGFENVSSLSPAEFLKMLSGAKYVMTDSFHGTAFSVLYHKNFTSVVNPHKVNTNSRIFALLRKLHLEDRIISTPEEFKYDAITTYFDVDEKMEEMQTASLAWLVESLQLKEEER